MKPKALIAGNVKV